MPAGSSAAAFPPPISPSIPAYPLVEGGWEEAWEKPVWNLSPSWNADQHYEWMRWFCWDDRDPARYQTSNEREDGELSVWYFNVNTLGSKHLRSGGNLRFGHVCRHQRNWWCPTVAALQSSSCVCISIQRIIIFCGDTWEHQWEKNILKMNHYGQSKCWIAAINVKESVKAYQMNILFKNLEERMKWKRYWSSSNFDISLNTANIKRKWDQIIFKN